MNDTARDDEALEIPADLRPTWDTLWAERSALFQQILEHLCAQRGLAPALSELDDEAVEALTLEAHEFVEKFDKEDLDRRPQPVSDLWRVLREHHEIGERILDIQDEIISRP